MPRMPDYIFRVAKTVVPGSSWADAEKKILVDVIDPRLQRVILKAVRIEDVRRKLGGT